MKDPHPCNSTNLRTSPEYLSNLYIRRPGLLGPSCVLFGVIEGANIAQDIGRPETKEIFSLLPSSISRKTENVQRHIFAFYHLFIE